MGFISGQYIKENAAIHEEECPEGMKDSFYYGFREGAKWMQHELCEYLKEIDAEGYRHIVATYINNF